MAAAPKRSTDVVRVGADIKTLAAHDRKIDCWQRNPINRIAIYMHQSWLALDRFSLAGKFVKGNSSVFDRRNHRRHLIKIAAKFFKGTANCVIGQSRNLARLDNVAFPVVRRRGDSERHCARVFLIFSHEKVLNFGASTKSQKKQTGRDRIECAAMADLLDLQTTAHQRDDIM